VGSPIRRKAVKFQGLKREKKIELQSRPAGVGKGKKREKLMLRRKRKDRKGRYDMVTWRRGRRCLG